MKSPAGMDYISYKCHTLLTIIKIFNKCLYQQELKYNKYMTSDAPKCFLSLKENTTCFF